MNAISDDGGSVDLLLRELYEKKRWLDMVIEGLEAALESPQHRLVRLAEEALGAGDSSGPRVDLGDERRAVLASLARTVGARRTPVSRRRGPRRRTAPAVENEAA